MFNREQFREEIAVQLKDVPREMRVAFAVRSAMRVLPLLASPKKKTLLNVFSGQNREAFWYWKVQDKNKHLLAVLRAYSCSIEYVLTKNRSTTATDAAAANAAADAADADAYAAAYAAYAAAAADSYAADAYADAAAYAAFAAYAAADVDADEVIQAIRKDLMALKNMSEEELLKQPLWLASKKWQQLLNNFKQDISSLNAGFEVWLDWYDDRLQGKAIDVELLQRWNHIPKEIQQQGAAKVNAYLGSLLQENITQPLNRVRAIFIGYGEAGKTSLIRALHGEDVIKGKEAMTAGIDIRDWAVPNTDIKALFWDFGGQVVFHSTHKFFLRSSCVYIVVINARANINNSEQAEYWLDHVKVFGDSASVLLVGNKADEAQIYLQMENLKQKYPNIKGFYPISCTGAKTDHSHQFDIFKQALTQELQAVGIHQMLFTPAQAKVLDEVRQNSLENAFLTEEKFNEICDKQGVSNEGELNRDWLVDIFDKLGVMLHFEELKTFNNAYMLNPRWLTHGVYTLMNAKQARLTDSEIVEILKNTKVEDKPKHLLNYPPDKCLFISKTMQRFKLCYPLRNGALLIPALLSDELPSYPSEFQQDGKDLGGFENRQGLNDTLRFEFAFSGFLPRNLIGEFMVSRYEEIKDDLQSQRGAVFTCKSCQAHALVEADYHRRLIIMQVCGRDAKEYLAILYDAMLTVFGDLALDYREWVNLPMSACLDEESLRFNRKIEKAPYQQLLAYARNKESKYISESGLRYDLGKVLGIILSEAEQAKQGIINNFYGQSPTINQAEEQNVSNQNITIGNGNTIHDSVVVGEKIEHSFNGLKESKADDAVKTLLEQLLTEIKALNEKVPATQAQAVEKMASRADSLINETKNETPDREWYEVSLKGILEAAKAIGGVANPVLEVAKKLSPLLLGV
jgi:GTPase SAR1 family protein